ncbi:bifunctional aspartate kinase/homoserine dehydrogenase I [Marivirga lumbricoides]|uniref:Bifunctional aspartate kinase/homoserine dehydrogenase I n=1 Tax=Marivirga lumbricoides TaxID=1046115 RepID=A0A2T4DMB5_9BACT|nr:bifunctional aspartate kinase/homoserine dehydrogenase I [Marivirga lumbricoides]GGC26751.1 bifunctional aspartate kinase/homoserine dehydrogenase I [Marivirga lumbricoides]
MQVLKFGGTSVGTPQNIRLVKEIVAEKSSHEATVVVVSAFSGITNKLIHCSKLAAKGDENYQELLNQIIQKHIETTQELISVKNQSPIMGQVRLLLNELEDILRGVFLVQELSAKTTDKISCYGEILSARIITYYLQEMKMDVAAADPKKFIFTDNHYGKANVFFQETNEAIHQYFDGSRKVYVCPGFLASALNGETTTLGRGGSDYTAAIIAAALNAPCLEIWTDVSGMMTANPQWVPNAYVIDEMDYEEAMELTHFGAKVLYPPSIAPVLRKGIPVYIKNTFKKEDAGTKIHGLGKKNGKIIKGLSCIENIALLNLSGSSMVGIPHFSFRLFQTLASVNISVILITQASSEHSICVAIDQEEAEKARVAIEKTFEEEIRQQKLNPLTIDMDLAIVALVGSNMKEQIGVSGRMLSILGNNGINIIAIAQGSSEKNISAVIQKNQIKKALNSLHESFFLSDIKRVNLFVVGTGNVGKALLKQLALQSDYLKEKYHLDLQIVGISNSRKMCFDEEGIDLSDPVAKLDQSTEKMDINNFLQRMISMNLRNSIFIDNTANESIAETYASILRQSISVVTPNKIACTGKYADYKNLKTTALRYKSHFHFETNVGAGLPIINTLNDLIKSGDEVMGIQAVLSGSLNFIFNNYDGKGAQFSEVVKQAQVEGYTEPDPRLDLSGADVKRKILILLRESGFEMEMDDIKAIPFIPDECMQAPTVDAFFDLMAKNEPVFKAKIEEAEKAGKKLKYVATYSKGKAETGLQLIEKSHPLYNLEGKDNIVLFTTKRYPEQPLVVKGAGAGADVTASGIFGDVMRIANTFREN